LATPLGILWKHAGVADTALSYFRVALGQFALPALEHGVGCSWHFGLRFVLKSVETGLTDVHLLRDPASFAVAAGAEPGCHGVLFEGVEVGHAHVEAICAQAVFLVDVGGVTALDAAAFDLGRACRLIKGLVLAFVVVLGEGVGIFLNEVVVVVVEEQVDIGFGVA
jgi:hypothetical protein